jgi:hypothetical protein
MSSMPLTARMASGVTWAMMDRFHSERFSVLRPLVVTFRERIVWFSVWVRGRCG